MRALSSETEYNFLKFIANEFDIPPDMLLHQDDIYFSIFNKFYIVPALKYVRFLRMKDRRKRHVRTWNIYDS